MQEYNKEVEEEKTELELINELQDAITESLRKNNESQCIRNEDDLYETSDRESHSQMNGEAYEMDKETNYAGDSVDNCGSFKRPLEEYFDAPMPKRFKTIGPKSRTKQRIRKKQIISYQPHSLTRCVLNHINTENVPDFYTENYEKVITELDEEEVLCFYCDKTFSDIKSLAIHEGNHLQVDLKERVDAPVFWKTSSNNSRVRNKWFKQETDDSEYPEEEIEDLLVPISSPHDEVEFEEEESRTETPPPITGDIVLVNTKPTVNGIPLSDISKDDRRYLFKTILITGVRRKFCPLCRFTFKDNWAIELHYFSSACYYTCRYCGIRFNKQRNIYDEHVKQHINAGDPISSKIYASRKKNDPIPKVIHETKIKTVASVLRKMPRVKPIKMKKLLQKRGYGHSVQIKKEPGYETPEQKYNFNKPLDFHATPGSQSSQNQAYFCRKCYKVFFKLDEFNEHVVTCKGTAAPVQLPVPVANGCGAMETSTPVSSKSNSESESYTSSGRPLRNCVKEISYNDDDVEPSQNSGSNSPVLAFECHYCNSTFPNFQSRNSHMRIHKNRMSMSAFAQRSPSIPFKQSIAKQAITNSMSESFNNVLIKQEPMEEVDDNSEFHKIPSNIGNVSITPISNKNRSINPEIMRLVQNNPNLTIKSMNETPSNSMQMSNAAFDETRMYRCSSCTKPFTNKSTLYFHKKNHCGGSKYPCPFCKKRFGTEVAYSSHIFYSHPE